MKVSPTSPKPLQLASSSNSSKSGRTLKPNKDLLSGAVHSFVLLICARRRTMSIQVYQDPVSKAETSGQDTGALVVLPNGLEITEEEHQKRIKDVSCHLY